MKYCVILIVVLAGYSVIVTENIFAEKCLPIELEHSIIGGSVTELCKSDTNVQVNAKIQAIDKGYLNIAIPQKVVYSLSGLNCELGELFVLMDGYETPLDNVISDNKQNIITLSFQEGNHTIAFVGSTILPKPGPSDYCGIVMGYDSLYLPPKFQEKKEVSLKHIRCNDNLVVLAKYDGSPACVKPSTAKKLIEREWGTSIRTSDLINLQTKTVIKNEETLQVRYSVSGTSVSDIFHDDKSSSLFVLLNNSIGGRLDISIPRELFEADLRDPDFIFVLIDNQEFPVEKKMIEDEITLTILFPANAHEIEIVDAWLN